MAYANTASQAPAIEIAPGNILRGNTLRPLVTRVAAIWKYSRKRSTDVTRLYRLNDHVLRDIGLTRGEIGTGAMESFWRD